MKAFLAAPTLLDRATRLVDDVLALVPAMQCHAPRLDAASAFPADDIAALRAVGLLAAPLPAEWGGLGLGTSLAGAMAVCDLLRLLGRGNPSLGRLFEAHVNAIRLIARYGSALQARAAAQDTQAGHLFGLWVTDAPHAPLAVGSDGVLAGGKAPCSGAGEISRAVVTAQAPDGQTVLLVVAMDGRDRASRQGWATTGMRAACNGAMDLSGLPVSAPVGKPGDYLREPDFSAGAWRTSAVTLGALEAMVAALRADLTARGRAGNPHQLARVGQALIAQATAHLWVRRAALLAEDPDADPGDAAAFVNLARIAVETATLDAMRLTQRALGMAAFRQGTLLEMLFRDLAIYLRQPAPDETLTEAAGHFMGRDLPAPC
jgi:alkylation response protein AidB-like acyl-CoA dehydrogenase